MSDLPSHKDSPSEEQNQNHFDTESYQDTSGSESDSSSGSEFKERRGSEIARRAASVVNQGQQTGLVISQNSTSGPSFGSIAVTNCADIHFGNKTYYKGPVTIKQFLYGSSKAQCNDGYEREGTEVDNNTSQSTDASLAIPNGTTFHSEATPNPHNKGSQLVRELWEKWRLKERRKFITIGGVLFCTILAFCLAIVLTTSSNDITSNTARLSEDNNRNIPIKTDIGKTLLKGRTLRIILRQEWIAQPPEHPADHLPTPVPYVIITHTATENCTDQASCTFHVRYIQTFHMESRNWWDIGYNFLVGGDGAAYEGRGWDAEGAHTKGYNNVSIGIAFIGTFNNLEPPLRQLDAAKKLIRRGIELKKISPSYKLYAHRQLIPSLSPGDVLFEEIKTWPHWSNSTE